MVAVTSLSQGLTSPGFDISKAEVGVKVRVAFLVSFESMNVSHIS